MRTVDVVRGRMGDLVVDERYSAVHSLTDGTRVRLRLLRPDDRERLRAGFERLSPTSRYRRFLTPTPRLTEAMLDYLTKTDGWNHLAVGAERLEPDGSAGEGLGVARFVRLRDAPDVAEAAVAVVDDVQGRGLGRLLLATLVMAARERGIRTFRSFVMPGNEAMRGLLGDIGDQVSRCVVDGLPGYDVALPPPEPPDAIEASLLYRLFRIVAVGVGVVEVVLRTLGLAPDGEHAGDAATASPDTSGGGEPKS